MNSGRYHEVEERENHRLYTKTRKHKSRNNQHHYPQCQRFANTLCREGLAMNLPIAAASMRFAEASPIVKRMKQCLSFTILFGWKNREMKL